MISTIPKIILVICAVFSSLGLAVRPASAEKPVENSALYRQTGISSSSYSYRNSDDAPLAEESWFSKLSSFFSWGKSSDETAAQGEELKLWVRELAAQLLANTRDDLIDEESITVCTFVNLNHLYATSGLGRYLGEQMISELQLAGLDVFDVRISPAMMIRQGFGEYGMSRDMAELAFVHPGSATVVGTYSVTDEEILINARLVSNDEGRVLSSASTVLGKNRITAALLADEARPPRRGTPVAIRPLNAAGH